MKPFSPFVTLAILSVMIAPYCIAGADNEVLGTGAGGTQAGDRNVVIGDQAGSGMTTANENTIVGAYAAQSLQGSTGSDQNAILGFRANGLYTQAEWAAHSGGAVLPDIDNDGTAGLDAANYGLSQNTYIGYEAGLRSYGGVNNTFIGTQAGKNNTYGFNNTFVGARAGRDSYAVFNVGTANDNTFIGSEAGMLNTFGSDNTYIGDRAGRNILTGSHNVAIGKDALMGATGSNAASHNTAVGQFALDDVNGSWGHSAAGMGAGTDVGVGVLDTFLGYYAGAATEHTSYNTFVGSFAGSDNNRTNSTTNAARNTYFGMGSGSQNRDGTDNVYIGAFSDVADWSVATQAELDALGDNITSDTLTMAASVRNTADFSVHRNVVVGSGSYVRGDDNVTLGFDIRSDAPRVIAIGSGVIVNDASHSDAILIGNGVQSRAANLAIIGNDTTASIEPSADGVTHLGSSAYRFSSTTAETFSAQADAAANASVQFVADAGAANDDRWKMEAVNAGNFKVSSFASGAYSDLFQIANTGDVTVSGDLTLNSDLRLKENVQDIKGASDLLSQIKGKSYEWKPDLGRKDGRQIGLIAQEVEQAIPELVNETEEGGMKSVNYQAFVPLLIDAVNEQRSRSVSLDAEIQLLAQQMVEQKLVVQKLKQRTSNIASAQ